MNRIAPATMTRNYHNPVQGPSRQGAMHYYDAGNYQQQPYQYGSPDTSYGGDSNNSNSSQNNVRHAGHINSAASRPASFDSDSSHSSKKQRLGPDRHEQHQPQGAGSQALPRFPLPNPLSSARPSGQTVHMTPAPRPPENTSLPRFSVPVIHTPSSSNSPALAPQVPYHPSPNAYPSRSESQSSSFPSPPLISPLNGSPYSRRESILTGSAPAAPSPNSSSHSLSTQYFASAPSAPEPFRHGYSSNYNGTTPVGPVPHSIPPVPPQSSANGTPHDRHYSYHGAPHSSGQTQFRYSQPFSTLSQQLTPSLPPDFEEREALYDSRGAIAQADHSETTQQSYHERGQHQYQSHMHNQYHEHHQNIARSQQQQHDPQYHQHSRPEGSQVYGSHHQNHQHEQPHNYRHYEQNQERRHFEQYEQHPGYENAGQPEEEDGASWWEPEPHPRDIEPLEEEMRHAPAHAAAPSQETSPAPARAAPLQDILHPVNETPLMRAAEIPARPANEAHVIPNMDPPPVEPATFRDEHSGSGTPDSPQPSPQPKRRQRSTFTQDQRDATSQTRTYGACQRCKSQRIRCVPSPLGPYDMCQTCELVSRNSKKVLHDIRCVRWRLTSMTTYRSGGLQLTKRWKGTEVHNVGDWVSDEIKEIDLKLFYSSSMHRYDLCDTPVKLRIREFAPQPDDVLTRKWVKRVVDADGTPKLEKKVTTLPAFALADVGEAEEALDAYFKTNTINAMYDASRYCVPIIREHYHAAIRHYESLPDGDFEKTFLEKFFRLWFYTRFTTGSSYISGGDNLGCTPVDDPDYPLGHRISVPRMITAQCDSIMVTKFLKPLSHDLTLELEKIFRIGNPDNWFTLYICTFMLLGEVSFSSQDRRRHGRENWVTDAPYSLYEFVADLQFGGNILLCYWHYYRTMDPMNPGWDIFCQTIEPPRKARAKVQSAKGKGKKKVHVTLEQRRLVMSHWPKMVELADLLSAAHHKNSFEHPLFFVSQLYMKEWEIREVYSYTPPEHLHRTRPRQQSP